MNEQLPEFEWQPMDDEQQLVELYMDLLEKKVGLDEFLYDEDYYPLPEEIKDNQEQVEEIVENVRKRLCK